MCVSAAVIAGVSLATAAVSTVMQIDNANYQHKMLLLQQQEQLKQLTGQRVDAEQAGLEAQLNRIEEFERQRQSNLAAMAAQTGFGTNMGYFQGTRQAEEKALKYDLNNIRLGVLGEQNRITGQERQIGFQRNVSSANRKSAVFGSLMNFASSAVGTAYQYDQLRTPTGGGGYGSGQHYPARVGMNG